MESLTDTTGHPIHPRAYVRVERHTSHYGVVKFRGLVAGLAQDKVGAIVRVTEWSDGRPTGRVRSCRPGDCTVAVKPASVKQYQSEEDRLGTREARLAQVDAEVAERKAKTRKRGKPRKR